MKKDYHILDPKIASLVQTMNKCGFETFASCQGHGGILKPYIAFKAPEETTRNLIKILRADSENSKHLLYWGWTIEGFFNEKFELVYSLTTENPHHWISKHCRIHLDRDIKQIEIFLKVF